MPRRIVTILACLVAFAVPHAAAAEVAEVTWAMMDDAEWKTKWGDNDYVQVPEFGDTLLELDGKPIRIKGYILPLETVGKQTHFMLSAIPMAHCPYCTPTSPTTGIETRLREPIGFTTEAIIVTGTLELLWDDPLGMFYRLKDGTATR